MPREVKCDPVRAAQAIVFPSRSQGRHVTASAPSKIPMPCPVCIGLRVRGTVQGVGFRPFVFRVATELVLGGHVRNDGDGVWIEVEGDEAHVERFLERLRAEAPPLARIAEVERSILAPTNERAFRIGESGAGAVRTIVPPDVAPCEDCLRELHDPEDRRHRYPFVNCTACGPRYSIVHDLPYDRDRTTMRAFALCARCAEEYADAHARRFHAEPNACPACGPSLRAIGRDREPIVGDAALVAAARAIREGAIVAVKGVGGFGLAVDARDEAAVARLRARKRRPHRPFALLARDLDAIERVVFVPEPARRALVSAARPIVLLRARPDADVASGVAPGLGELGIMLPPSPLHALLAREGPELMVLTSGNVTDEPIAKDDDDALERLSGIADLFLVHDRAIHTRVDDSVVRVVAGAVQPVRRARGLVPVAIPLPVAGPPVLAVGADLKSAICIGRDGEAFVSQHLGDLASPRAFAFFEETVEKLIRLLGTEPEAIAHDLHPEYRSTRWALERDLPRIAVQHHHAHVASCLAEHGRAGPAIGVAFDGTGCGPAGELWGGEILVADLAGFRRAAHLRPLALPGGEAAIRDVTRLALAALVDAGEPLDLLERVPRATREGVATILARGIATPRATSAGRWFDAIAAIVAVRDAITYEGQAAIELEAIAAPGPHDAYPFVVEGDAPSAFDLRPVVRAVAADVRAGVPAAIVSARFHETLAKVVHDACVRARDATGVELVALSGGCFQNVILTERALDHLSRAGFEVLIHRSVPPNDGGVALGQAAIATQRLRRS